MFRSEFAYRNSGIAVAYMEIRAENVSYKYEKGTAMEVTALDSVSLTIGDGEFIGLIGHTGSGKSTFVQILNGLLEPSEGAVFADGRKVISGSEKKKRKSLFGGKKQDAADGANVITGRELRTKVGLVFQYPEHQLFEIDVLTDVMFGPKNMGLPEEECKKRAEEALSSVGIAEELYSVSPFALSGGQKRRVAIAGVLAMMPSVLILDEPTAGLDPKGRDEILDLISMLHKTRGITVILVSHSMEDVARLVDRILVFHRGKLVFDDVPREVFRHGEELVSMGLAVPAMTDIMHYLSQNGIPVKGDALTVEEAADLIMDAVTL